MLKTITVTRHPDGSLTGDGYPEAIAVSHELVKQADARWLRREGDLLYFALSNGSATYRIVDQEAPGFSGRRVLHCVKL
jgi:hypothetical protein